MLWSLYRSCILCFSSVTTKTETTINASGASTTAIKNLSFIMYPLLSIVSVAGELLCLDVP